MKNIILSFFILAFSSLSCFAAVADDPDLPPQRLLPFPYKKPSAEEKKEMIFVPQYCYTVLKKGAPKSALVGPLKPCLLAVLRDLESGTSVVFHKNYENSLDNMIDIAKAEFGNYQPSNIMGHVFTNVSPSYDLVPAGEAYTLRALHRGKSQEEEVFHICDALNGAFSKKVPLKFIEYTLYKSSQGPHDAPVKDEFAEAFVHVDGDGTISSLCPMAENVFGEYSGIYPLTKRCRQFHSDCENKIIDIVGVRYLLGGVINSKPEAYESRPFRGKI